MSVAVRDARQLLVRQREAMALALKTLLMLLLALVFLPAFVSARVFVLVFALLLAVAVFVLVFVVVFVARARQAVQDQTGQTLNGQQHQPQRKHQKAASLRARQENEWKAIFAAAADAVAVSVVVSCCLSLSERGQTLA